MILLSQEPPDFSFFSVHWNCIWRFSPLQKIQCTLTCWKVRRLLLGEGFFWKFKNLLELGQKQFSLMFWCSWTFPFNCSQCLLSLHKQVTSQQVKCPTNTQWPTSTQYKQSQFVLYLSTKHNLCNLFFTYLFFGTELRFVCDWVELCAYVWSLFSLLVLQTSQLTEFLFEKTTFKNIIPNITIFTSTCFRH